ncbi:secreted protein, partial [Candidatus Thiomargarita nelsonii]
MNEPFGKKTLKIGLLGLSLVGLSVPMTAQAATPTEECDLLDNGGDDYKFLAKYDWQGGVFSFSGDNGSDGNQHDVFTFSGIILDEDDEPTGGDWQITSGSIFAEGLIVKAGQDIGEHTFTSSQNGSFSKPDKSAISHLTFCYLDPLDHDPTAVDLTHLSYENGTVVWETAMEDNSAGFNV